LGGLSKTQSRQLVGVLNELAFLVDIIRHEEPDLDQLGITKKASRVPIGIMRKSYPLPDQAVAALVEVADDVN